jgi:hypothetical protein
MVANTLVTIVWEENTARVSTGGQTEATTMEAGLKIELRVKALILGRTEDVT